VSRSFRLGRGGRDQEAGAGEAVLVYGERRSLGRRLAVGGVGLEGLWVLRGLCQLLLLLAALGLPCGIGGMEKAYPLLELQGDAAAPGPFGIAGICSRSQGVLNGTRKAGGRTDEDRVCGRGEDVADGLGYGGHYGGK